ncbi:helix-turn-helix domain-containing protein [Pelagibacterium flavum]|uniref:Helix-turn-helix domain-containing protein n=1 Tax=Pelagibacterium flavum TaxID=2984530 RepID=A0ABY6IT45_9HYPH|nr:helix-turn-helix domain-containing protein [Pelagibacterium sp. YIM 151497]UYQ72875.1 helix-turn-helix domain-containing protein [Pelagibacterium sp. YIM 151497]
MNTNRRQPIAHKTSGALIGYVTTEELASSLGVHPTTLAKWRTARKGPPFARMGHRVLYNVDRFKQWLAEQEIQPISKR